jgi:hypothetical protein
MNKKQSKYGYEFGYCGDVTSSNDESFCIVLATKRQLMITSHPAMMSSTKMSCNDSTFNNCVYFCEDVIFDKKNDSKITSAPKCTQLLEMTSSTKVTSLKIVSIDDIIDGIYHFYLTLSLHLTLSLTILLTLNSFMDFYLKI